MSHYKLIGSWIEDDSIKGFALTVHTEDIEADIKGLEVAAAESGREDFRVSVIEMTEEEFVQELDLLYPRLDS